MSSNDKPSSSVDSPAGAGSESAGKSDSSGLPQRSPNPRRRERRGRQDEQQQQQQQQAKASEKENMQAQQSQAQQAASSIAPAGSPSPAASSCPPVADSQQPQSQPRMAVRVKKPRKVDASGVASPVAGSAAPAAAATATSMSASPSPSAAAKQDIVVLKVGSASLSSEDCKLLHLSSICALVELICRLRSKGLGVILVSSGAVAVGCQRLGLSSRPTSLVTKQAVAAIGQSRLMRVYDDLFANQSQPIAQVLLTRDNLSRKHHYVNALNTFNELLRLGVIPIVNENDTVSIDELKVGDNDTLSARVASLVQAKWLFLLTDVDGLYDCDPRSNPHARLIHSVSDLSTLDVQLGSSGSIGTGGMGTKLLAASIATQAGVHVGILRATRLEHVEGMMRGEKVGTHFLPSAAPLRAHKKWIAHGLAPQAGAIIVDDGAARALSDKKSLFAKGCVGVSGSWNAGDSVRLLQAPSGSSASAPPASRVYDASSLSSMRSLGVALVNFSSSELARLCGKHSSEYAELLGYQVGAPEVAHRENIVLNAPAAPQTTGASTQLQPQPQAQQTQAQGGSRPKLRVTKKSERTAQKDQTSASEQTQQATAASTAGTSAQPAAAQASAASFPPAAQSPASPSSGRRQQQKKGGGGKQGKKAAAEKNESGVAAVGNESAPAPSAATASASPPAAASSSPEAAAVTPSTSEQKSS